MTRLESTAPAGRKIGARPGFTLVEMIVSLALLAIVMVMVSQIFKITSNAASQTQAQSEVFSTAAAFRELVTDLLSKMEPGFLAIECPPPTTVRAEHPGGPVIFRQRNDRLVFFASGSPGEFQSFAARQAPDDPSDDFLPDLPVTSSQALICFGPGITRLTAGNVPVADATYLADQSIPASEWVLSYRALLIGSDSPNDPSVNFPQYLATPNEIIPRGGLFVQPLPAVIGDGRSDVIDYIGSGQGSIRAGTLIARLDLVNILAGFFGSNFEQLWAMNYTPPTATMGDSQVPSFYTRSGFNFAPHLSDLRIDWTDGRAIDPHPPNAIPNFQTRWFGLRPNNASTYSDPASIAYRAHMRTRFSPYTDNPRMNNPAVNPNSEAGIFQNSDGSPRIEWSSGETAPGTQNRYRAIWRRDTWSVRPKALRFTFRVYDRNGNLSRDTTVDLNEDGIPDDFDLDGTPDSVVRYGQEFSFVVPMS